jgi:hypothetical protein
MEANLIEWLMHIGQRMGRGKLSSIGNGDFGH